MSVAGLKVFPVSPAIRERKIKLRATRELVPLMAEIIDDLSAQISDLTKEKDKGDEPALMRQSKVTSKLERMKELCEKLK